MAWTFHDERTQVPDCGSTPFRGSVPFSCWILPFLRDGIRASGPNLPASDRILPANYRGNRASDRILPANCRRKRASSRNLPANCRRKRASSASLLANCDGKRAKCHSLPAKWDRRRANSGVLLLAARCLPPAARHLQPPQRAFSGPAALRPRQRRFYRNRHRATGTRGTEATYWARIGPRAGLSIPLRAVTPRMHRTQIEIADASALAV